MSGGWSFKGPENGHYGYDHIAHPGETFGGLTEFRLLASLTTTTSMSENFFLFFSLLETLLVVMVIYSSHRAHQHHNGAVVRLSLVVGVQMTV